MAEPVTMPQLGESVTEGTISRWLKAEGEEVEKDEPLCEVETDKVNSELPSPMAGKIQQLLISEGTTVDVGTEIALVAVAGEAEAPAREDTAAEAPTEEFPAAETEAQPESAEPVGAVSSSQGDNGRTSDQSAATLRRQRSSPVVRRLAEEHDVELSEVSGSGLDGRVTRKDIERHLEEQPSAPSQNGDERPEPQTTPAASQPEEPRRVEVYEGDEVVELTGVRRAIATRMSASKREAPHAWTMVEVDVTGLAALRAREKDGFERREGIKLTYLPFIVRAVVESLKEHPVLNSVWDEERIVLRKNINAGIAVDLEDGLMVPVIPDADSLSLLGLARAIDDRVRRAREKRLGPEDVAGGTFTVNNPGSLGSVISTPIINHPQAAILSAEAIVKRPVVIDDAIAVRSMMNLEVSFDHRILDGGAALKFLNAVKRRLESLGPDSGL